MAQTSYPFSNSPLETVDQWQDFAQNLLATGVIKGQLNEMLVYADSTGMQCKVKTGSAYIQGFFYKNDPTEVVLAIATANSSNPRIDRIVLQMDKSANSVVLAVLQGVPAVSPVAPALTQNNTRWEISLAQVLVGASVSTIAAGNVTDERNFAKNANAIQVGFTDLVLQNGWTNYGNGFANAGYRINEIGELELRGRIKGGTVTTAVVLSSVPIAARPYWNKGVVVICHNGTNVVSGEVDINADGTITGVSVQSYYVSLDGIKIPIGN